jgi:hypothetical protein
LGGGSFNYPVYFLVSGRYTLPKTFKVHVVDGKDTPEELVAFTNQVCVQDDTSSMVVVIGVVNVTTGESSIYKM